MKIILSPKRVALYFSLCVSLLVLAHLAQRLIAFGTGHHSMLGLVPLFDLRQENNLPTWYSSSSLLFSGALLALIARARREAGDRDAIYWVVLAVAFTFLSIDEAASIHEKTIRPLRHLVGRHGIFTNTWILLGGPVAVAFGLAYLKFLFRLPARVRYLLILAGAIYVTGAVGLEAIDGYFQDRYRGATACISWSARSRKYSRWSE